MKIKPGIPRLFVTALTALSATLFWGCPTTPHNQTYDYTRSPLTFHVDAVPDNHPGCASGNTPFPNADSCQHVKKYRLQWERPEDTTGFQEYRIYLDTVPPNAPGKSWAEVRQDRSLANFIIPGTIAGMDSLIFILDAHGFESKSLTRGVDQIVAFDTTSRTDTASPVLVFAIVTAYTQAGYDGAPRYTEIITNDKFPPNPVQPKFQPLARSLDIQWSRPRDPTSFFDPGADSGLIREYILSVKRDGIYKTQQPGDFNPTVRFFVGGVDRSDRVVRDSLPVKNNSPIWKFHLPDSNRVINRTKADPRDSLRVVVENLTPRDTLDLHFWAVDSSGNATDSGLVTRVLLTDTTEPTLPKLKLVDTTTRNQITYSFAASRDTLDSTVSPVAFANFRIQEYHVSRVRLDSVGGAREVDSVWTVQDSQRPDTVFTDTVRFLPPGAHYRIFVESMDSTGHLSQRDSLDASTAPIRFTGSDSANNCPLGFVPIPAGSFLLGDTASSADSDEKFGGTQRRFLGSYCIEAYEHKANSNAFVSRTTWQQADSACLALSPQDNTHLCTEAEWERACEGTDSIPLVYGVQSEKTNPGGIRYTCNIGTGDSAMAMSPALRDPACINYEGVFDMSGNLAEWVLDPYVANAYANAPDTLTPGLPLSSPNDTGLHTFRGTHYLSSHLSPDVQLHAARCSNRDYPTQVRPQVYPGCIDPKNPDQPMVVVLYQTVNKPRCFPVPDTLRGRNITSILPYQQDSTKLQFLLSNSSLPYLYTMPADTTYAKARPFDAKLTPKSLAAVVFINTANGDTLADTLDATEMRDTSDAALSLIFNREVSPPWTAQRSNGQYAIHYLYAWSQLLSIPARRHYSDAVLGFRCCSLPHKP